MTVDESKSVEAIFGTVPHHLEEAGAAVRKALEDFNAALEDAVQGGEVTAFAASWYRGAVLGIPESQR